MDAGRSSWRCRSETVTVDIHCVTKWSKLDTVWTRRLGRHAARRRRDERRSTCTAFSDGGYTTNLPLADLTAARPGSPSTTTASRCEPEHGGPARLLVPHLYFWKSAKWVRGLELRDQDEPGFWEGYGYHDYGDPWLEQRYQGD